MITYATWVSPSPDIFGPCLVHKGSPLRRPFKTPVTRCLGQNPAMSLSLGCLLEMQTLSPTPPDLLYQILLLTIFTRWLICKIKFEKHLFKQAPLDFFMEANVLKLKYHANPNFAFRNSKWSQAQHALALLLHPVQGENMHGGVQRNRRKMEGKGKSRINPGRQGLNMKWRLGNVNLKPWPPGQL